LKIGWLPFRIQMEMDYVWDDISSSYITLLVVVASAISFLPRCCQCFVVMRTVRFFNTYCISIRILC
jgi:hypothetical protein